MTTALSLQLPEHIYLPLLKRSSQIGQTPETLVTQWLETFVKRLDDDPLLQLAGVFESDLTDIGERHDEYIGQSLSKNNE